MTMGLRDFTKSGAAVAIIFALVVALLPFGLEEIGETTGLFDFPAKKTITELFAASSRASRGVVAYKAADWERYRRDLEEFTRWAEDQNAAVVFQPLHDAVVIVVEEDDDKPDRRIWSVPVASCTAGNHAADKKGYLFISGFDHPFEEGTIIEPSEELCGYEIVFIGERSVWLRVVAESEGYSPMGIVKFPEFTRVEGESLVKGNRKYVARDAFPLPSGGWMMVDSFIPPDGTVFKILDEKRHVVATILCVVIGEKGGRR